MVLLLDLFLPFAALRFLEIRKALGQFVLCTSLENSLTCHRGNQFALVAGHRFRHVLPSPGTGRSGSKNSILGILEKLAYPRPFKIHRIRFALPAVS